jgi:hypothetical protein
MERQELEHIVRAAAGITGEKEFIVLGSQSILGKFPDAPNSLRHSMEVDIYPREHPELIELINGCLGEFSAFHTTFDYYADGVSPTTAVLHRFNVGTDEKINMPAHGVLHVRCHDEEIAARHLGFWRNENIHVAFGPHFATGRGAKKINSRNGLAAKDRTNCFS